MKKGVDWPRVWFGFTLVLIVVVLGYKCWEKWREATRVTQVEVVETPIKVVGVEENNQQGGGQEIVAVTTNKKVVMRTVASTKQRQAELRRQIAEATNK